MKKNTIVRALAGTLLAATALNGSAAVFQGDVGFVTVQDLVILQNQALTFGQNIIGTAGTTCLSTPNSGTVTGAQLTGSAAPLIAQLPAPVNSGTGCIASTNALSGVFQITTSAGTQATKITIASITGGTDFDFSPVGYVMDSAGLAAAETIFFPDTVLTFVPTLGLIGVVVGGTITIGGTDLTANTPYSAQFDVTATF
ncbi:MAG: hypothetical protein MJK15_07115 [Colwellia sp.]|nr:hypothetical protein [Colwellia sp.]